MAPATIRAELGSRPRGPVRRGHRWLARRAFLDRAGGPERTVLLAGSGRSGTTWLAELLTDARTRLLFEPLHPVRGPFPDLGVRRYARPREYSSTALNERAVRKISLNTGLSLPTLTTAPSGI